LFPIFVVIVSIRSRQELAFDMVIVSSGDHPVKIQLFAFDPDACGSSIFHEDFLDRSIEVYVDAIATTYMRDGIYYFPKPSLRIPRTELQSRIVHEAVQCRVS